MGKIKIIDFVKNIFNKPIQLTVYNFGKNSKLPSVIFSLPDNTSPEIEQRFIAGLKRLKKEKKKILVMKGVKIKLGE